MIISEMILLMAILFNNGFMRLKLGNFACAYGHLAECFYQHHRITIEKNDALWKITVAHRTI